jgi:hypothetical protein
VDGTEVDRWPSASTTASRLERPYPSSLDELTDHLALLALKLDRAVTRFRQLRKTRDGLEALAISDAEIDDLLPALCNLPTRSREAPRIRQQVELIRARSLLTRSPEPAPLHALDERFQLGGVALEVFVLCLAPEVLPGFGRVYAYLHDDATRTRPTVALVLEVLGETWSERLALRSALLESAPLVDKQLLSIDGNGDLTLAPGVLRHLLGPTPASGSVVTVAELLLSPTVKERVERAASLIARGGTVIIGMKGESGSGKRTVAAALAALSGRQLLERRISPADLEEGVAMRRWLRDALLSNAAPFADLTALPENLLHDAAPEVVRRLTAWQTPLSFVSSEEIVPAVSATWVELTTPAAGLRAEAWRRGLGEHGVAFDETQLAAVASLFPFHVGQIRTAARTAAETLGTGAQLDAPTWRRICRGCARHHLERMAERLPTPYDWSDLVLPRDHLSQLREIADAAEKREQVLERWRFGDKVCVTPGVSALFFGASGTGKTMAAGVLASHLGMDLFRIDLSRVVSKYIGETEKNLDALFAEARRAYAVLFFDEADALFGKRSEVKDAHDRYANIEVAYLLQRMESYEGLTVLATNLHTNLDEAFLRRLQFSVEFPQPTVAQRRELWRKMWPGAAPLGADLDLEFVARELDLTGGQIRNIALRAAYLAAGDGAAIGMRHLIAAVRREHQKLGRLTVERTFGPYASLFAELERA